MAHSDILLATRLIQSSLDVLQKASNQNRSRHLGRFKLWADEYGTPHGQLDKILKESPILKEAAITLLADLCNILATGTSHLDGNYLVLTSLNTVLSDTNIGPFSPQISCARNASQLSKTRAQYTRESASYSLTLTPTVAAKGMRSKPLSIPCLIFRHCWSTFLRTFLRMLRQVAAIVMRQPRSRKRFASSMPRLTPGAPGFLAFFFSVVYYSSTRWRIILGGSCWLPKT